MSGEIDWVALAERVIAREQRAVARLCRLVDDRVEGYQRALAWIYPRAKATKVIGITGIGGSGKSTLVDGLIRCIRQRGDSVAVLAVDPTSSSSGGAILGDRIRMQKHFLDQGVFIRSVATRGYVGGVSRSTAEQLTVLRGYGCDYIIVETVGVGQDELQVAALADTTVVVTAPGLGDHIQAIKAGILEIADVFVVNKSDQPGADRAVSDLEQMIALNNSTALAMAASTHANYRAQSTLTGQQESAQGGNQWEIPVLKTVARQQQGIPELLVACQRHSGFLESTDFGKQSRRAKQVLLLRQLVDAYATDRIHGLSERYITQATQQLQSGQTDPFSIATEVVERIFQSR